MQCHKLIGLMICSAYSVATFTITFCTTKRFVSLFTKNYMPTKRRHFFCVTYAAKCVYVLQILHKFSVSNRLFVFLSSIVCQNCDLNALWCMQMCSDFRMWLSPVLWKWATWSKRHIVHLETEISLLISKPQTSKKFMIIGNKCNWPSECKNNTLNRIYGSSPAHCSRNDVVIKMYNIYIFKFV